MPLYYTNAGLSDKLAIMSDKSFSAAEHCPAQENVRAPRLLDQVITRLRLRHYSKRTEQAYVGWIKRYILFHDKRHPREMGKAEVEAFLSALAVPGLHATGEPTHFETHERNEPCLSGCHTYALPVVCCATASTWGCRGDRCS